MQRTVGAPLGSCRGDSAVGQADEDGTRTCPRARVCRSSCGVARVDHPLSP